MTDDLQGKHAVVLGFGRQGKALARWLPAQGARVTISDQRDMGQLADELLDFLGEPIAFALGGHPGDLLDDADLLCLSGGVPLDTPIVQQARERGIPITNDAMLFLERCPALVIGITGSAGKTTTTTLVGEMCQAEGHRTWVGGNIGQVLLDDLDKMSADDRVVMELSSFQLEIAPISPDIASILNVTPNHLDRHKRMMDYIAAKANIFQHQAGDDLLVLGLDNQVTASLTELAPARVAHFSTQRMVSSGAFMLGRRLAVVGDCSPNGSAKVICDQEEIRLRGEHNLQNVLAACALAGAAGIGIEAMHKAISSFNGVAHRLELVATHEGVTWINDSIATAPERVVAALRSFTEPIILLAGGRDKDLPWAEMAGVAIDRCRIVITFGEHGNSIAQTLRYAQRGRPGSQLQRVEEVSNLEQAVNLASRVAQPGEVVLLSPGGTSFDAYRDFAERGDHFRDLVEALSKRQS